jgi:hypothetical protein
LASFLRRLAAAATAATTYGVVRFRLTQQEARRNNRSFPTHTAHV